MIGRIEGQVQVYQHGTAAAQQEVIFLRARVEALGRSEESARLVGAYYMSPLSCHPLSCVLLFSKVCLISCHPLSCVLFLSEVLKKKGRVEALSIISAFCFCFSGRLPKF
jgi:hypothetical protein